MKEKKNKKQNISNSARSERNRYFSKFIIFELFSLSLCLVFPIFANATIYAPGATLNPDCAPNSSNCGVYTFSLNNLTGISQLLTTGTTGTDFSISSASTTHTFNLPTASASNRGLLSSTDWNNFNDKLSSAYASSTYLTIATASSTYQPLGSYLTVESDPLWSAASSSYLTLTSASSTYATLSGAIFAGAISSPNFSGTSTGINTGDVTLANNINGLTISGQALTLGLAGASATGTLSATDWNTFNNKLTSVLNAGQIFIGDGSNIANPVTLSGDGSLTSSGILSLTNNSVITSNITNKNVTYGKFQDVAASKLLGNSTISAGTVEEINIGNGLTFSGSDLTVNVPTCAANQRLSWNGNAFQCLGGGVLSEVVTANNFLIGPAGGAPANPTFRAVTAADLGSGTATNQEVLLGNLSWFQLLDGSGKINSSVLPSSITGSLKFQGTWDADTNSPTLTSGGVGGVAGDFYIVDISGTTTIDGHSVWNVGDWIINASSTWDRVEQGSSVASVNGQQGTIILDTDDVNEGLVNKYFSNSLARNALSGTGPITLSTTTGNIDCPTCLLTTGSGGSLISGTGLSLSGSLSGRLIGSSSVTFSLNNTAVTADTYGSNTFVPTFTVDAQGRLTSAGTTTLDASAIASGNISVAQGGTGAGTFITNGVLYGSSTNALLSTAAGTSGQFLIANTSGIPVFVSASGDIDLTSSGLFTIATGTITSTKILDGTISNSDISGSAGISYNKLNLNNSIVNGDILTGTINNSKLTNYGLNFILGNSGNDLTLSSSTANLGDTLTINIPDASIVARGVLSTSTQTIAGDKTFSNSLFVTGSSTFSGNFITPRGSNYSITGTQNDVDLGNGSVISYTGAGVATFTGFIGGTDGRQIRLINNSSSSFTLNHEDSGSLASNRLLIGSGLPIVISQNGSVTLLYDSAISRWRLVQIPASSAIIGAFAFLQNGNAYGTTASLGTTDTYGLNFITSGNTRFSLASSSTTLTGNGATSITANNTLSLSSANGSNLSIISGTTGNLNLDSGSTGAINIGSSSNTKIITIGNGTGATAVNINSGTGGINLNGTSTLTNAIATNLTVLNALYVGGQSTTSNGIINAQTKYQIAGNDVLSANTLGTGITSSSLTSLGTLSGLNVSGTTGLATTTISSLSLGNNLISAFLAVDSTGKVIATTTANFVTYNYASSTFASTTWINSTFVPYSYASSTYLTSEYDTLASILGRGATTSIEATFSGGLVLSQIRPEVDSTTALTFSNASGTNTFFTLDTVNNQLQIGTSSIFTGDSLTPMVINSDVNNYTEFVIHNNNAGNAATADIIASADNDGLGWQGHYIDMGITSSNYTLNQSIQAAVINYGGINYQVGDLLTVTGGDGTAKVKVETIDGGGQILTLSVYLNGTGYSVGTNIPVTGGSGSGDATIDITEIFDDSIFGANNGYLYTSGGDMLIGNDTAGKKIVFFTGGFSSSSERMAIQDNGFVGIGTITPYKMLDVYGGINIGDPAYEGTGLYIGGNFSTTTLQINDILERDPIMLALHRHSTSTAPSIMSALSNSSSASHASVVANQSVLDIYGTGVTNNSYNSYNKFGQISFLVNSAGTLSATSSPGDLQFLTTTNGTTTPTEKMRILANGNIGIGTTTPTSVLSVIGTTTTNGLKITNLASSLLSVDALGNVIGTSSVSLNWGSINGVLSSQTDLQTALDAKLSTTSANSTYLSILNASSTFPTFSYASNTFATILNYPTYGYASSTFELLSNKSNNTNLGTSSILYPTENAVKTYVDSLATGLIWNQPAENINVISATGTPILTPQHLDSYFINTGAATGTWSAFAEGDLVQYQTDHWVKIKSMVIGDRFGVSFLSSTIATGDMAGYDNYYGEITGGTAGAYTYTFTAPVNNNAILVSNSNAFYYNSTFVYSANLSQWVQLSSAANYAFLNGLDVNGRNISLGELTADWNQTGVFNINTAGKIGIGTTTPDTALSVVGTTTTNSLKLLNLANSARLAVDANGNVVATSAANVSWGNIVGNISTQTDLQNTFLSTTSASTTYLSILNASSTYLTIATASSTYATQDYVAAFATNYPTYTYASSSFLSFAYASSTFASTSFVTTNYVPYTGANADVDLGVHNFTIDGAFFVDATSKKISVGTTSILTAADFSVLGHGVFGEAANIANTTGAKTLNVIDSDANTGLRLWNYNASTTNNSPAISLVQGTNDSAGNAANTWWDIYTTGGVTESFDIRKRTGGANDVYMTILANGNVGIGTTTPGTTLSVAGTSTTQGLNISNLSDSLLAVDSNGNVIATTTSQFLSLGYASSTYLSIANASSTYYLASNPAGYLSSADLSSYLSTTSAASIYLTINNATSTYLSQANASTTFATINSLGAYLSTTSAASTYLTIANAGSNYVSTTTLTTNYVPYTGANADVNLGSNALTLSGQTILANASTTNLSASGDFVLNGNFATPKGTDYITTGIQNNLNFGAGSLFRYNGVGVATFTGITGGTDGRQIHIMNVSSSNITITHQDASSTDINRIITSSGGSVTVPPATTVALQYDSGVSRWRILTITLTPTSISSFAFLQNGNAYGTTATIGTTDGYGMNFITSGTTRFGIATSSATITGSGATSITTNSTLALSSAGGSDLNVTSGTTGNLNLDSGSTGGINIGTNSNNKTITIGNGTGTTSVVINAGTGNIDIGANAIARTINIGTGAAVIETINVGGTGANVISIGNTQTAGSISLGASMTNGTISIGGTGLQTGNIDLAPGTGAQTVTLANSSGVKTLNIGNGISGNTISIGNGDNTSAQVVNIGAGAAGADSTVNVLTGIATAGTQTLNLGTGASSKNINIGNQTGATALTLDSGTGSILIGTGAQARTINIGTGAGVQNVTVGSTNTSSTLTLESGTGALNIGAGAFAKTITLGNSTGATGVTINSGTNGITLLTGTTGNVSIKSGTTGSVTLDSGTTGTVNIGNGNNSKTINIGTGTAGNAINIGSNNTTADNLVIGSVLDSLTINSTGLNLTSGGALTGITSIDTIDVSATALTFAGAGTITTTGSNAITLEAGGTGVSNKVQIGTITGKATPDLLVLDAGTGDPTGVNGGMYYSTATNKFRCYENGAWRNCTGSQPQQTTSNFAKVTLANTATLIGTFSITPTTAVGDVYVYANLYTSSLNNADQTITAQIRSGATCAGTLLATGQSSLINQNGIDGPAVFVSTLVLNPGASAQSYAICGLSTQNNGTAAGGLGVAMVIDSGADLAEMYTSNDNTIQPGEVVSYDPALKTGISKSQKAYDLNTLGIISTQPGMLIGKVEREGNSAYPVALSGRVPVKVSSENGDINIGDYLTSSAIPGVAMKATSDGMIIGQAISSFAGEGVGQVMVFIKNTYSSAGYSIKEQQLLLGDISPKVDATSASSTSNGLETLLVTIQSEIARTPSVVIGEKIVKGKQFLTDLVTARVTAIRGYFEEIFTKKIHTEQICVKKSDGTEICVTGDQLQGLVGGESIPTEETTISTGSTVTPTEDTTSPIEPLIEDTASSTPVTTEDTASSTEPTTTEPIIEPEATSTEPMVETPITEPTPEPVVEEPAVEETPIETPPVVEPTPEPIVPEPVIEEPVVEPTPEPEPTPVETPTETAPQI